MMAGFNPRKWEIWLATVYFEDNPTQAKERPVIILDITASYVYVAIKVTSSAPRAGYPKEYVIRKWAEAGLDKHSTARCSKILRIPRSEMIHYIGTLHPVDIMGILKLV